MRLSTPSFVDGSLSTSPPEMPRQVWRRLFSELRLSPGSVVLVVGRRPAAIVGWLKSLFLDVSVVVDEESSVEHLRRACVVWSARHIQHLPRHRFDAIVMQPLSSHGDNWLSTAARLTTAMLLSSLKPCAAVAWWQRPGEHPQHLPECWVKHLGCFPGSCTTWEIPDSLFDRATWHTLRCHGRRLSTALVVWQAPREFLSREDWQAYVHRGLLTGRRPCCTLASSRQVLPCAA